MNENMDLFRRIIQKRLPPNKTLDPFIEHAIFLDYVLFLERLAEESTKNVEDSKQMGRSNRQSKIKESNVSQVTQTVLEEFRG
ncbi:hypothetical protein BJV82DRAFT_590142 [Fennellomyces sp. T-0311]|nr:hypothetical protein BJV82DRAFT_590142 [Fennellomyces sp. T-0311]